jgi:hypothetical protein
LRFFAKKGRSYSLWEYISVEQAVKQLRQEGRKERKEAEAARKAVLQNQC